MTQFRTARVGDLVKVVGGGTPTRSNSDYYGGSIPWVTPKDMKSWSIEDSQIRITDAGLANSAARLVPEQSILIVVRSGVLKHTLPVGLNRIPVTINQDMKALLCGPDAHHEYLARFIKSRSNQILSWVRATTADNFSVEKLKDLVVPLPSMQEQQRIARMLDRADELRAKRRAALAHLDNLTQSVFLDMFPRDTPSTKLRDHLSFITSGGRGWARYYAQSGPRFIRSLDVRMNEIDSRAAVYVQPPDNAEARRTVVQVDDVLLTITGSRIGRVSTVPPDLAGAYVSQHVAILRLKAQRLRPQFLSYFLSFPNGGQRQIAKAQYGQTKPGLNFEQIGEFEIPTPPLRDQDEFRRRLAEVDRLKAVQRSSVFQLDTLFTSLQDRAFAGAL